jgi:ribosomal-protein-alanine N-acetyltransferase
VVVESYFLRTESLGFRTWAATDRDLAVGLWCDRAVTRWFGGPYDEQWASRRLAAEIACMEENGYQYWPIFLLADGEHIGACGMRPRDPEARINGFGFHLRPRHWGRGYATEAARAAIRYAFEELDVRALFAGHHPQNRASPRVLEKLGFRYTHDELYPPTGLQHHSYLLAAGEQLP